VLHAVQAVQCITVEQLLCCLPQETRHALGRLSVCPVRPCNSGTESLQIWFSL